MDVFWGEFKTANYSHTRSVLLIAGRVFSYRMWISCCKESRFFYFWPTFLSSSDASSSHDGAERMFLTTSTTMAGHLCVSATSVVWEARHIQQKHLKDEYLRSVGLVSSLLLCLLTCGASICKRGCNCSTDILKYVCNQPWASFSSSMWRRNSLYPNSSECPVKTLS